MTQAGAPSDTPVGAITARVLAAGLVAQLRPAIVGLVLLTLLTGGLFPWALYAIAPRVFPDQAAGSLITDRGAVVGSRLIGQSFARPGYFHPRPSTAGSGYDATASGGSNLAPANPKLIAAVGERARAYRLENGLAETAAIPIDAVTGSGSGLDPDISPSNAALQLPRVARTRGLAEDAVRALVAAHTQGRQLGFMGEPRVCVLELNLALDRAARPGPG